MKMWIAVAGVCALAASADAALLNLSRPTAPGLTDVNGGSPAITYNSSTHLLSISGATSQVLLTGNTTATTIATPIDGTWVININVNSSGVASGGSITITGAYPGPAQSTLLTSSNLQAFGFDFNPSAGLKLEFFFGGQPGGSINSSSLAIGAIVADSSITATSFASSFTNDEFNLGFGLNSTADAFLQLPAPGASVLLAGSMIGIARRRRR
jgi:hypothetical protein